MNNPEMGALFASAARQTREDLRQTASRLVARATDLAAHTSGALARQVDELGERLSRRVAGSAADALSGLATRTGDALVDLGERLSRSRAEHH